MNTFTFFLKTAWRSLVRGGQRAWVAVITIAFGVMSLVAMTLVSQSFESAMVLQPREQIGADISLERVEEDTLSPENVAQLEDLQQAGKVEAFTLVAYSSSVEFHLPGSSNLSFLSASMGIDPQSYPLAGALTIGEPGNVGLATLLQEPGDVILTRDVAEENRLHVGDTIVLSNLNNGLPVEAHVRGIASDTPNHQGSKMYYNMATAEQLNKGAWAVNVALANAPDPAAAGAELESAGWRASLAQMYADNGKAAQDFLDTMLRGAGILGLMVGGIGVANTMQVLLRRRQKEIAIWKALGYQERDLQMIFTLEAAIMGAMGSLLGVALGLLISRGLLHLFIHTGNLLVSWSFSPYPLIAGALVGILTTVIFSLWAILSVGKVQPMALLRNEPLAVDQLPRLKTAGLALLMALPFTAITSLVMGSLLKGVGVLLFALIGLLVLGGLLGGLAWVAARWLPVKSLPLVRMAQNSLKRRGLSLVFAMIALFTGIVAMALGVVVTQSASGEMQEKTVVIQGSNLQIIAPADQQAAIEQAIAKEGIENPTLSTHAHVQSIQAVGQDEDASNEDGSDPLSISPVIIGRSQPGDFTLTGAAWGTRPEGAYTYGYSGVPVGSRVLVTLKDGTTHKFEVVGAYDIDWGTAVVRPETGLLLPAAVSAALAEPDVVIFFLRAPAGSVNQVSSRLGKAIPDATIVNLVSYVARYTQAYHNLFLLALAMAGLALLAGVLLVANSVSLSMLERRYEIGVLKAVGYSQAHILTVMAVEYALVALIATLTGLAAVQVFFMILGLVNDIAAGLLVLTPLAAVLILVGGVGLILVTVLGVTWGPARVSPVVILNDRA